MSETSIPLRCRLNTISTLLVFAFVSALAATSSAQELPSFDIYVVGMSDGKISTEVFALKNITDRDGYDNQPSFSNDGNALVYTSDASGNSMDIFRYVVRVVWRRGKGGFSIQMTYSDEDEFSPGFLPERGYSVVRVEQDGRQRLWALAGDALTGVPVLEELSPVGYYARIDADRVAVFILGDPVTLQIANVHTGQTSVVASDIGRSILRIPGSDDISFVHKETEERWVIKKVDPDTGEISNIAPTYGDGQDFAWTPSGTLLMADGAAIYEWVEVRKAWRLLHDFKGDGITNISRLTINPQGDLLAFVAER